MMHLKHFLLILGDMTHSWFQLNPINTASDLITGSICFYTQPEYLAITIIAGYINLFREANLSHDTCFRCHPKPQRFISKTFNVIQAILGSDQSLECSKLSKVGLISSLVCTISILIFKSQIASFLVGMRTGMLLGRLGAITMLLTR